MEYQITVKGIRISEKDETIVRGEKWEFINNLNHSGVLYASTRFISAILNETMNRFNSNNHQTFPVTDNYYARELDINDIRAYSDMFFSELKLKNVNSDVINYLTGIVNSAINILEKKCLESGSSKINLVQKR